jgi:glutathione S-transferase
MDSTLILEYAHAIARPRTLMPAALPEFQHALKVIGLALAACEKAVQIVYERGLRPPEKLHEPWVTRVTGQLLSAFGALEKELTRGPLASTSASITQAGVSTAVAWHFTQQMLPEIVSVADHPNLAAFSARAEALPEFRAAPYGDGIYQPHGHS